MSTFVLVGWLLAYAPTQAGSAPLSPALEARVQTLGKQLRCAVCQGVAIADSPASMARAQLDKVRELVSNGQSDEEIRTYFVARYGEWVLLEPPRHGVNWLVWLGPLALLLVGLGLVVRQVRPRGIEAPPPPPSPAADPYRRAVRAELER
jgi:cytochrome c-type biogenesis protein CcmH